MAEVCSICLEDKSTRSQAVCIPCGHTFCVGCISKVCGTGTWHVPRLRRAKCPECRAVITGTQEIFRPPAPRILAVPAWAGRRGEGVVSVVVVLSVMAMLLLELWHDYKQPDGFLHSLLLPALRTLAHGLWDIGSPVYGVAANTLSWLSATWLYTWVAYVVTYIVSMVTAAVCLLYSWIAFVVMSIVSMVTAAVCWLYSWIAFVVMSIVSMVTAAVCWLYNWIAFVVMSIVSMVTAAVCWLYNWIAFVVMSITSMITAPVCWLYSLIAFTDMYIVSMVTAAVCWLYSWTAHVAVYVVSTVTAVLTGVFGWAADAASYVLSPVSSGLSPLYRAIGRRLCVHLCPCGGPQQDKAGSGGQGDRN